MHLKHLPVAAVAAIFGMGIGADYGYAANYVINGDFSGGDADFSSDYASHAPIHDHAQYTVTTAGNINGASANDYGDWNGISTDPTGSSSGNVLIADGATGSGQRVWYQTISVTPHTDYTFSFYGANVNKCECNNASLGAYLERTELASIGVVRGTWTLLSTTFNSNSLTSIVLAIVDGATAPDYDDFAISRISLVAATTPLPPSALLLLTAVGGLGFVGWRRRATATAGA